METRKTETPTIIYVSCEKRVPLWDEMEQIFASAETQQRVQELQKESALALDNESKERALVGEVISTVALAGQISRELNVSDHGITWRSSSGTIRGKRQEECFISSSSQANLTFASSARTERKCSGSKRSGTRAIG
jgi:hypothetical protein